MSITKDFDASAFSDFWPTLNAELALLGAPEAALGEARHTLELTKQSFSVILTTHVAAAAAGLVARRAFDTTDEEEHDEEEGMLHNEEV